MIRNSAGLVDTDDDGNDDDTARSEDVPHLTLDAGTKA